MLPINKRRVNRRGIISSAVTKSALNSLDWDSPSTKTGTVKRRPISSECSSDNETQPTNKSINRTLQPNKYIRPIFINDTSSSKRNNLYGSNIPSFINHSRAVNSSAETKRNTKINGLTLAKPNDRNNFGVISQVCKGGSDSDSGIASPLSPSSLNSFLEDKEDFSSSSIRQFEKNHNSLQPNGYSLQHIKIYTDWANHYLEKARSKKRVNSLAADCSDGVLLAEVIESVTCQKIPDINRKPKTPSQMLDNINLSLRVLQAQHVQGVESVSGQDLRDGRLKAILALFFALSKHKQATKQRSSAQIQNYQQQPQPDNMPPNRSVGVIQQQQQHKGGSSIPLPGSALPARRCPPDKVRPVVTTATSSRASSPALSMIPRCPPTTNTLTNNTLTNNILTNNSINNSPINSNHVINSPYQQSPTQQKNSMLDKLKLFKSGTVQTPPSTGKRTSSSSGVSSARSERSDSSLSLEPNASVDLSNKRNNTRVKQQTHTQPHRTTTTKHNSPNTTKKTVKVTTKEPPKVIKPNKAIEPVNKPVQLLPAVGTGIPKPTAAVKGTTKVLLPKPLIQSPLKSDKDSNLCILSESSHSTSTGQHSNSSESSVIYRASSASESDSRAVATAERYPDVIPNRVTYDAPSHAKHPNAVITSIAGYDATLSDAKHTGYDAVMKQSNAVITSNAGYDAVMKQSNAVITSNAGYDASFTKNVLVGEHDDLMCVEPMRPLLRGYSSTLTLPARSRQYQRVQPDGGSDYCEVSSFENGYLSDGECLGGASNIGRDLMGCDGYMSEGGNALYARRIAQTNGPHHNLHNGCSTPSSSPSLTVLTEQAGRRGRVEEPPPPPTGPRRTTKNGSAQFPAAGGGESKHGQGQQWKRYTDSPGVGSPPPPPPAPSSPTSYRRERRSSPHGGGANSGKEKASKVRGVPQSFGYVKRGASAAGSEAQTNGSSPPPTAQVVNQQQSGKTAQVSAVPRTKVKVSGGTQTCSSDLQQAHKTPQFKSYSLTGNAASQLSQSVRERLMGSQSLPKGAAAQEFSLILRQGRPKVSDGSLSDTQAIDPSSPYAPWLRHSNTYSVAPRLSETDSMESLSSLPGHRGSLTHARLLRDSPSRLSRSNSIRSTKSEKLYPSMLHRNTEPETEPYYCLPVGSVLNHWSQPSSPAPGTARAFPLSPTHSTQRLPKNDDVHGSSVSLVSTASSLYSSAEEKQAHEIRKLRRELVEAQEKVQCLTSQLSTNAHVVSAFEQSLSSMTQRLQHLTATSEKKDSELIELRSALDALRTQSIQAGIGTGGLARQPSSDSVSSLSSACSLDKQDKKKKKGWLRSSFTKAFSRNAKVTKVAAAAANSHLESDAHERHTHSPPPAAAATDSGQEVHELQKQLREKDLVLTDIRLEALSSAHQLESLKDTVMKMRSEMLSLKQNNERLQRMAGGGGGGGASSNTSTSVSEMHSSHSMDPLNDLLPTEDPAPDGEPDGKHIAISVYLGQPHTFQRYYNEHYDLQQEVADEAACADEIAIAHTSIGAATNWGQLDNTVRRAFKQHVARLDPGGGLGLGSDSVALYKLGEAERASDSAPPHLLPVGYVVGCVCRLHVVLQPVAALAFEALIPKGVAQRLVSLLAEHRRLVLCGAPGTGKTHLATRLAEFHAQSLGREPAEAVATFNVDNKSGKELRQYLAHLSEQATAAPGDGNNSLLPSVVVLDNLHKAGPLADALGPLPRHLPCLLGTMAQSACSATSLQLQHGFRWVLVAPHMEPARGLLGRVLRRRLAALELEHGPQPELAAILGWLPRVWQHLNAFLETHSSGDVAIGPQLFLSCPLELDAARAWFADVWNYSLAPYLREAAREGLQLYGRRAPWTDPCQFVLDTYPWPGAPPQGLTCIPAQDVGLEVGPAAGQADNDSDPLLNMLMRLQEAANYSSPHSNDSDCNSLESNVTHTTAVSAESVS